MRTRVKICGITSPEDGRAAADLGADAIGLVFYAKSPRAVGQAQARAVLRALPAFVTRVALFVDPPVEDVRALLDALPLDLLQFHGDEPPGLCEAFGRPYIKALKMARGADPAAYARRYASACGLLLDAYRPGVPGGTGATFDWSRVPRGLEMPVILAGGLTPANVAEAVRRIRPYAVDVSGGVERAPGVKDHDRMADFIRGVESARAD